MAKLDKLILRGIRSFGAEDEDQQEIKFASPLTLILGENGCGKTTIIEALNYACSGDFPGGEKAGFVHDPRISQQAMIKGQVKLRLIDMQNNKYTIIKSMQVVQKMASQTFKSMDSTITKKKLDGTSTAFSGRCADINEDICKLLGVSKPILNYVIFCHQEEALWPLEEPKRLKEKFDKIFDATKYNKCIESIRKIYKEKEVKLKVLKVEEVALKDKVEYVQRKRQDLQEKQEKLASINETITNKQNELHPITDRLTEISRLESNLQELQKSYASMESDLKNLVVQQKEILKNLDSEYIGSDEDLQREINSFESNRETEIAELDKLQSKKSELQVQQKAVETQIEKKQFKIGELQEEKKQLKNAINERDQLVQQCAKNLDLKLTGDDPSVFMWDIEQALNRKKDDLKTLIAESEEEETRLQKIVNDCIAKLAETKNSVKSKQALNREIEAKIRTIAAQLRELSLSDERSSQLKESIDRIEKELNDRNSTFNAEQFSQNIDANRRKIRKLENDLEEVEAEYKILQQNMKIEGAIDVQQQQISKKKVDMLKLQNKHQENFETLFENDIPTPGKIKNSVERIKQNLNVTRDATSKKIKSVQKELTTSETLLRTKKERLLEYESELDKKKQQISLVCKKTPFEQLLNETTINLEKFQREKGQFGAAKVMYEKYIGEFENDNPCCPVCTTGFKSQPDVVKKIVKRIRSKIQSIPSELKRAEEKLRETQELQSKLLQLKPVEKKVQELLNTILPQIKSEVSDWESKSSESRKQLEVLNQELRTPTEKLQIIDKVLSDSTVIDQYQIDIDKANAAIDHLKLDVKQVASKRTRQEVEFALEDLKSDLSSLRKEYEDSQKRLQSHKERCEMLREEKNKLVQQQLELHKAMQGSIQLKEQHDELNEKCTRLKHEISELQLSAQQFETDAEDAEMNRNFVKNANKTKQNEVRDELNRNRQLHDEIQKCQNKIKQFMDRKTDEVFEKTLKEINFLKEKHNELKRNGDTLTLSISELIRKIDNQVHVLRTLQDNINLRKKRKDQQFLSVKMDDLKRKIGENNSSTLLKEKMQLSAKYQTVGQAISRAQGSQHEIKEHIKELETELNRPDNRQAATSYKRKVFEVKAEKVAAADLVSFMVALENCLTTFHKERMVQINKIIRQLWRTVYKGNDCECIEIKAEVPKKVSSRRVFDYRVVQVRNGVEVEMRGRCSAGQKVLACLIIRMALAETFSRSCGILALDEPTTNLDRGNMISLSEAIARTVNSRRTEKNFQLIVITHDYDFLQRLTHNVESVDHYWNVSRNDQGKSVIKKQTF